MDARAWKSEIFLAALVAVYIAAAWLTSRLTGLDEYFHPVMYFDAGIIFGWILLKIYIFYYVLRLYIRILRQKPADKKAFIKEDLFKGPLNGERWRRALPVFIVIFFMLSTFSSMKVMIPHLNAFQWDDAFVAIDRVLHFGKDPWQWLQPVLGYAPVTYIINVVYNMWLLVLFVVLYWQLFSLRDPRGRMQFFIAFVLTWVIVGNILATYFSSAGPCFLEPLTGNAHFRPLMDYLATANQSFDIMALRTQDMLWNTYQSGKLSLGGGISAMPSVHVATSLLYVLLAWRHENRLIKALSAIFLGFIIIGSVHLGWHYAIDGYLAIPVTIALWVASGRILSRLNP